MDILEQLQWNHEYHLGKVRGMPKHAAAVEEIKRLVTAAPVLRYYDTSKLVTMQSDASRSGLVCCLQHGDQPVAVASNAFTEIEQNYTEKASA